MKNHFHLTEICLVFVLFYHRSRCDTISLCPIEFYHEQFSDHRMEHENDEPATGLTIRDILPEDPSKYDKMRPPKRDGNPTKVFFHVTVMGLDSIDENSMTYAADIFFAQTWKDHRLRLPENMTTEYRLLEVEWLKNMWRPDSFFKNAKSVTFQTMTIPNHYMWLYKDKTILYMVKLTLRLSCAMNFMIYPHDTQECKLQMESLSHTTDDMIFQWDPDVPLVVDENIELPQLALVKNHTADCTQVYSTGNFTCLEVVFQLKRRLGYYLFHTYIPTCLIVIMSWVSFWIKPEAAPARVTLGVTSLLTLSTQHAKSQAALPPVSYLKAVDAFMSACTVFVFMALMEYCLVNIVLGDSDVPKPPSEKRKSTSIFEMPPPHSKPENSLLLASGPPRVPAAPTVTSAQLSPVSPDRRLVSSKSDAEDVKKQAFFRHIQWEKLLHRRMLPPFVPTVHSMENVSNFDEEFTSEKAHLTPPKEPRPMTAQDQNLFKNFIHGRLLF